MTKIAPERVLRKSVLVVDDDEDSRRAILDALTRIDGVVLEVHEAHAAQPVISRLERHEFDLVLSDHQMPGALDGVDVLQRAHAANPTGARVLITGRGVYQLSMNAVNRGHAHALVSKPFKARQLQGPRRNAPWCRASA